MSVFPTVTSDDLTTWAATPEAAAKLPVLVRRLLGATQRLSHLEMRADGGVRLPGYDGVVIADSATAFCPAGESLWELSTRADVKVKLTKDYAKRKTDPGGFVQADKHLVFVTARRFSEKVAWGRSRSAEGIWKSVRVLDSDDLAAWAEVSPAVAVWFAREQLGLPADGFASADAFLSAWSRQTRPPLPPNIAIAGRGSAVEQLHRWLRGIDDGDVPALFRVAARTRAEAVAFTLAAIDKLAESAVVGWRPRVVVAENMSALRWGLRAYKGPPVIFIPSFDARELVGNETASARLVLALDVADVRDDDPVDVALDEPLAWRLVEEGLVQLGVAAPEARRVARASKGWLDSLRRQLGLQLPPAWAESKEAATLVLLLVGAWNPANEADRRVVEQLGAPAELLDGHCAALSAAVEGPIERHGAGWAWRSHADSWFLLERSLAPSLVGRYLDSCQELLAVQDEKFDLPAEDRWRSSLGTKRSASPAMLRGVMETLLYLSTRATMDRARVGRLVADVLTGGWKRWATLSDQLPFLAEAAPDAFLDSVERELRDPARTIGQLFRAEDPMLLGGAPQTGLIWALQTLAWSPRYASRVVQVLAELASLDPGGSWSPRPGSTLDAVFHLVVPQTLLSEPELMETLRALAEARPSAGWSVLKARLRDAGGGGIPQSRRPHTLDWNVPLEPVMPTYRDVGRRMEDTCRLAMEAAGTDASRWCELVSWPLERFLSADCRAEYFAELGTRQLDDPAATLWSAVGDRIADIYKHGWVEDEERGAKSLEELRAVYQARTPTDPVTRIAWMFRRTAAPREEYSPSGWREAETRMAAHRVRSLNAFLADAAEGLLERLAEHVDQEGVLGATLADCASAAEFERILLREDPPEGLRELVVPFAVRTFFIHQREHSWLSQVVSDFVRRGETRLAEELVSRLPDDPRLWNLLDELGDPIKTAFWLSRNVVTDHEPADWERAMSHLLAAGNVGTALDTASYRRKEVPVGSIVDVLRAVADRLARDGRLDNSHSTGHSVEALLDEFEARAGAAPELEDVGFRLEIRFLRLLSHSKHEFKFIADRLEADPALFADLVRSLYRAEREQEEQQPSAEEQHVAEGAWQVLQTWRSWPGRGRDDPEERDDLLESWAREALRLTAESGRGRVGQSEVANVLARARAASDGHWPCMAARRLLATGDYQELGQGLATAKRNLRGMTSRGGYEGGQQERVLAEVCEASAAALRARWPAAARVLEDLSRTYSYQAERHDLEAREVRLQDGEPAPGEQERNDEA